MNHNPPKLPLRFFRWYCHPKLLKYIEGDLMELYEERKAKSGKRKADGRFIIDVLLLFRPGIIKPREGYENLNNYGMLKNYLKIGWRSMTRQRLYSSIKVGGFALGIAACLLITLFIRNEVGYDLHYPKGAQIYRVVEQYDNKGEIERGVHLPAPFKLALLEDYPEVEQVARINPSALFGAGANDIRRDGEVENTHEEGFVWVDPEIMQMLDIMFVYGNAKQALSEPNSLVITKSKADKYFPNEDPIGKLMVIANDRDRPYKIGGVIEDTPTTSHLRYDFFMTLSGKEFGKGEQTNWLQTNYPTYVLLKPGADPVALERKLTSSVPKKYYLPRLLEVGYPNIQEEIKRLSYQLQPVHDIYLNTAAVDDGLNHGDSRFIWLSGAVAVFILIIACVNFINLSTAKSANRAREVGLRKVVGSLRTSLINQFLTESILYSLFSFILGLGIAWVLVPFFNTLVGKTLIFPWHVWWLFPGMTLCALIIGIVAGIYPSFYLSSFKPIDVLKGSVARGSKSSTTRSILVVFQFTTSIVLIIGTFVIYRQMQYILNSKVGFNKDQVILIQGTDLLGDQLVAFKNELLTVRDVRSASASDYLPIRGTKRNGNGFDNRETAEKESVGVQFWRVDKDYITTLGMKLAEGRNFSDSTATDSDALIINQAMAKELGLKNPVGKIVKNYKDWTIIGVVEDFNYESLKENVRPLCLALGSKASILSVKVSGESMTSGLASITSIWKKFAPQQPIRYTFLNDSYARMYEDVGRMGNVFTSFSVLAILVACLGLFGLSSFMIEQRNKEISIRLVLGASVSNIFTLLTGNFVKLVLIAFVIATPVAWYVMTLWLEDYVYRTDLTVDIFILAGAMAFLIALSTISYQAIRVAFVNPVKNLRSE
jgi:putative ABC transport system permease protein